MFVETVEVFGVYDSVFSLRELNPAERVAVANAAVEEEGED